MKRSPLLVLTAAFLAFAQESYSETFFESTFEGGTTLLAESLGPGAKKIILFPVDDLFAWDPAGGRGWIKGIGRFTYAQREGRFLYGVKGVSTAAPAYTEVLTAGFFGWDDVSKTDVALISPGIHGAVAARIQFNDTKGFTYISAYAAPSPALFGRFAVIFSKEALKSHGDSLPRWFFETLSEKTGIFRIGLVKQNNVSCLSLRFHVNVRKDDPSKHRDIYLTHGNPVAAEQPYLVEFEFQSADSGGAALWINDTLVERRMGCDVKTRGPVSRVSIGAFSAYSFDRGHIIVDDVALAGRRLGPVDVRPRRAFLQIPEDTAFSKKENMVKRLGMEQASVVPGQWFALRMDFRRAPRAGPVGRVHLRLTHFTGPDTVARARAFLFSGPSGYHFSFHPKTGLVWCKALEGSGIEYEVSKQKHKYVGALVMEKDGQSGVIRIRLSEKAKQGPLRLAAFTQYENEARLSRPVVVPVIVSEKPLDAERPAALPALLLVAGLAVAITLFVLKRRKKPSKTKISNPYIRQSIQIILEEFNDPELSLQKIAEKLNVSRSHLSNLFKHETGKSFPQFLNNVRINKAKELLKSTNMRISEIAFKVGYGSYEYFNSAFTGSENTPPGDFRKKTQ